MSNSHPTFLFYVTHFETDGPLLKVWGQTNQEAVKNIETIISNLREDFIRGIGFIKPHTKLIPNTICCAYHEDGYYRAQILRTNHESGTALVQFIDYGNVESVAFSAIRILNDTNDGFELQTIPGVAVDFTLANVLPFGPKWDPRIVEKLKINLRYHEYPVSVGFVSKNRRMLNIFCDNKNFSDYMVHARMARSASDQEMMNAYESQIPSMQRPSQNDFTNSKGSRPHQTDGRQNHQIPQLTQSQPSAIQTRPTASLAFIPRQIKIGDKIMVQVSQVDDGPIKFSIQRIEDLQELENLMKVINSYPVKRLSQPSDSGTVCLGRYSGDKFLRRAVVNGVTETFQAKVLYVDYGNQEICSHAEIYDLPAEFVNPNPLSLRFTLSEVRKLVVTTDMKQYFEKIIKDKTLLLHVRPTEDSPLIQYGCLYDNDQISILDKLIQAFPECVNNWPEPRKLNRGFRDKVHVSYVEACSRFFVQRDESTQELDSLTNELASPIVSASPAINPNVIKLGLKCLAQCGFDSCWYRAEITEVKINSNMVKVQYVDYGNDEVVPISSLRSLTFNSKATQILPLAIQCALSGYEESTYNPNIDDEFEQIVLDKLLIMDVNEVRSDGTVIVDLYDASSKPIVNISPMLRNSTVNVSNGNAAILPSTTISSGRGGQQTQRSGVKTQPTPGPQQKAVKKKVKTLRQEVDPSRVHDKESGNQLQKPSEAHGWRNSAQADNGRRGKEGKFVQPRENFGDKDSVTSLNSSGKRDRNERDGYNQGDRRDQIKKPCDYPDKTKNQNTSAVVVPIDQSYLKREVKFSPVNNITLGAIKNCQLAFATNPSDFYIQLYPDNSELDKLMDKIAQIYETGGSRMTKSTIKKNACCVAQYSEDNIWYRALIEKIDCNSSRAMVKFIDYGNSELVALDKIKEIVEEVANLPTQAIHCKLLGITGKINEEQNQKFHKDMDVDVLEAEFVGLDNNDGSYEILIRQVVNGVPIKNYINEYFVQGENLTKAIEFSKNKSRKGSAMQMISTNISQSDYASFDETWVKPIIYLTEKHNVIVTWFDSPESFYVQCNKTKNEFRTMMDEIQQLYVDRKPINNSSLKSGTPVIALFSNDDAFYRAEIVSTKGPNEIIVKYVDFGNQSVVKKNQVFRVEKKFMKLPQQGVQCSLENIVPLNDKTWSQACNEQAEKLFDEEQFECIFNKIDPESNKCIVQFSHKGIDLAQLLVDKKLASFASSKTLVAIENTESQPNIKEHLQRIDIGLLKGQTIRVKVSNVVNVSKFFIQLPSAETSKNVISKFMAEKDPGVMQKLSAHEVACLGAGCLVQTDQGWQRAVVINCSQQSGFNVRFIDTGANHKIPVDCMLALPSQLTVMQNQAIECFIPNGASSTNTDAKFKKSVENKQVIVRVEDIDNDRLAVKIYDSLGQRIKINNNDIDEKICPICPMVIMHVINKVTVPHLDSSQRIWLKRTDEMDIDAQLLGELYDFYSTSGSNLKPEEGKLCAAQSCDCNWYRGKVVKINDHGALIRFIDYGNTEQIGPEMLKELEPQFYELPELAVEVSLSVPVRGSDKEQKNILTPYLLDKEFDATMYNFDGKWIVDMDVKPGEKISSILQSLNLIDDEVKTPEMNLNPNEPEQLVPGEKYNVLLTHVDSPAQFWIQRLKDSDIITELQDDLQQQIEKLVDVQGIPAEKLICAAVYSVDNLWYRAEIIDADADIATVRFIDFGNTDVISYTTKSQIKHLPESLKSIEGYAIKCRLDLSPVDDYDWSEAVCQRIESLTASSKNISLIVIANNIPKRVELFADDRNIGDILVEEKCAVRVHNQAEYIDEIIERELDPRSAFISHINSPSEFWIQQEKFVPELELIADRFMVADMLPNLNEIKEGELCVTKFPEDGMWYRAKIISHGDTGTNVIYIDYGNSAVSTDIRVIPSDLAEIPPLSRKCYLPLPDGIEQWSHEACQEFIKMADDGATIFHLDILEEGDEISKVKLTLDGKNIVEELVRLCKVLPPVIDERLSPLGEENSPNVLISNVFSPAEFSIQAECKIPDLEIMAVHLGKASSFLPLKTLEEKTICAAQFPEDGLWYRAEILCHSESETEVLYIDYGNTAITSQLRALPEDIINIPPLSRLCSLVMPKNIKAWSEKACEKFFELVADGQTMFQYKQLDEESPCHISLSIDNQDILEILIPLCTEIQSPKVDTEITAKNDNHDAESQCNSSDTSGVGPSGVSSDASATELQINEHLVVDCLKKTEYSISQNITEIIEQSEISEIVVKQSEDKKDLQKQEGTANETAPDGIYEKKSDEKEVVQSLLTGEPITENEQIENSQAETIVSATETNEAKKRGEEDVVQLLTTDEPNIAINQIENLQVETIVTTSEIIEEIKISDEEIQSLETPVPSSENDRIENSQVENIETAPGANEAKKSGKEEVDQMLPTDKPNSKIDQLQVESIVTSSEIIEKIKISDKEIQSLETPVRSTENDQIENSQVETIETASEANEAKKSGEEKNDQTLLTGEPSTETEQIGKFHVAAFETDSDADEEKKNGNEEVQSLETLVPSTENDQIGNLQVETVETPSEISEEKTNSDKEIQSLEKPVPSSKNDQIENLQVATIEAASEANEAKKSGEEEVVQSPH